MKTAQDSEIRHALGALTEEDHSANVADPTSFHPFPARMPVPLAEYLLRALVPVRARVLDPMAGSGSTLVAARKLGHTGHGVDMDPLAVLMSRIATGSYRRHRLDGLGDRWTGDPHRALADALACRAVWLWLEKRGGR